MAGGSSRCGVWQEVLKPRELWIEDMNKTQIVNVCVCMCVCLCATESMVED